MGKTWAWLEPQILNQHCQGYSGIGSNGKMVLIANKTAESFFCSSDAGDTWDGPYPTGTSRATLNVVGDEFWLAGAVSRARADGKTWRDLPAAILAGKIATSEQGTLISVDRQRFNILRSVDNGETWCEVNNLCERGVKVDMPIRAHDIESSSENTSLVVRSAAVLVECKMGNSL